MGISTISSARKHQDPSKNNACTIDEYTVGLQGLMAAEYDNIRMIFAPEDVGKVLLLTARPALQDFAKTLREVNSIVLDNMASDPFVIFVVLEHVINMAMHFDNTLGPDLRKPTLETLQPIRETAKMTISKFTENTKGLVQKLSALPQDGGAIPATVEVLKNLQRLASLMNPVVSVLGAVGEGNWGQLPGSPSSSTAPSIRSFDTTLAGSGTGGSDGPQIFVKFCGDVLETLVASLDSRGRLLLKTQAVQSIFMLNNISVIENSIKNSDLSSLLLAQGQGIQPRIDTWKSKHVKLYINTWLPASQPLMDVQYTNRNRISAAAVNKDSASIVGSMPSKEREAIKEKFRTFNALFDELVAKHRSYKAERDVKAQLSEEISKFIEPLYSRFWDRYHEVDRKSKYVKYDKQALAAQLAAL
jgi:exocyst complex protein 7